MVMREVPTWAWVVCALVAVPKLYYLLQVGRRKKGELRFRIRRGVFGLLFYLGGVFTLIKLGYKPAEALVFGFVLGIGGAFFFVRPPARSRIIPAHIKRAVIERDLKGAKFDSTIHHIDHIVPYSKGGDNSVTNLRVIPKTQNLRRGARSPELRDFVFRKRRY
ncbi:MAG: HNH endonuclease [Bryobacteraceae bacterium]